MRETVQRILGTARSVLRFIWSLVVHLSNVAFVVIIAVSVWSVLSGYVERIFTDRQLTIETVLIVGHLEGSYHPVWGEQGISAFVMPRVHNPAQSYTLPDRLNPCKKGRVPVSAWHEIVGSWPEDNFIYTINASVSSAGEIQIDLRAREKDSWPREGAYVYIDVYVLCGRSVISGSSGTIPEIAKRLVGLPG